MTLLSSRRQLVAKAALTVPAVGLFGVQASHAGASGRVDGHTGNVTHAQTDATPAAASPVPASGGVGSVDAPAWRFSVLQYQDPYKGDISRPNNPDPNTRYIGAEVAIINGSTQPMNFSTSDVHLKEKSGFEYPAGSVLGAEPKLVSQNLPDGERTRGWVWFMVPKDEAFAELRFNGPSPVFRVTLPGA